MGQEEGKGREKGWPKSTEAPIENNPIVPSSICRMLYKFASQCGERRKGNHVSNPWHMLSHQFQPTK